MGKITNISHIDKTINTNKTVKKNKTGEFGKLLNEKLDKASKISKNSNLDSTKKTVLSSEDKAIIDKAIKETPDVRADRIAEIKAKIENGTYDIDTKTLAEAMLKKGFKP